jgi:8-oxo-dGTP pyrophosphatase MutT (NUDIX family)
MKVDKIIALIKERVGSNSKLPGWKSHKRMAVIPINSITEKAFIPPADAKQASVSIILFEKNNQLFFLLTKRTENVEHHKGQVSLPGGAIDKNETAQNASLRETKEEIGIDSSSLKSLGQLSSLYTPVSYFNIHVFLWYSETQPQIKINESEVDQVYKIGLDELIDNNLMFNTPINKSGFKINVPAYHFNECICWGATAMIITELKDIINES